MRGGKAGGGGGERYPAAVARRADLVGVCTTGNRQPIVVDVTVVLPHNPDVPGEPIRAGTAAHKAVAGKRAKYDVIHSLTTDFHVAALKRFGYLHPDTSTIRLARIVGAIHASRQAPLMEDHIVAGAPDQSGLEARGAGSSMASRILTRMSVALQRSNAIRPAARCQRERTGPLPGTVASAPVPCQVPSQVEETRAGVLACCWRGRERGHAGQRGCGSGVVFCCAGGRAWRRVTESGRDSGQCCALVCLGEGSRPLVSHTTALRPASALPEGDSTHAHT